MKLIAAFRARLLASDDGTKRVLIYAPDEIHRNGFTSISGGVAYPLEMSADASLPDALEALARTLRDNEAKKGQD